MSFRVDFGDLLVRKAGRGDLDMLRPMHERCAPAVCSTHCLIQRLYKTRTLV